MGCRPAPDHVSKPPTTVRTVDVPRYLGHWYEIATIPTSFERDCVRQTTADYALAADGLIKVVNRCTTQAGQRIRAEGRAHPDPKYNTPARLRVTFVNFLGWQFALSGDYWIMDLDPEYTTVLIGHPQRKYAWILSRKPVLDQATLREKAAVLRGQGYDTCKLLMTPQTKQGDKHPRLCDVVH